MEQRPSAVVSGEAPIRLIMASTEDERAADPPDPAAMIMTCANCGAMLDERKCKLICRCGYFLSCSDYY